MGEKEEVPRVLCRVVVRGRRPSSCKSRLYSYDLVNSEAILTAQHNSVQHHISVCTKFVEPFQAQLGSLYIVLGETELGNGEKITLKARVFTCVEGMNLQLLEKAILEQREYFQEREKQLEGNNS
ncbi:CST complex subunit TEN1 isoform X2 [Sphaerodactylus townsendi]|uniref:CST complex subunit TEN1 isoform X2 n=1 Tax=Sphaerodactylus townsendi TaxID=933632 RepID=UPI002026D8F9|nr:CST complex subunit TEN1 isoform X2 [Sphaerodactylus townsendi]